MVVIYGNRGHGPRLAMVVMTNLAVIAIPVTGEVLLSIMMRLHPSCAGVGRARPISVVPLIVVARRTTNSLRSHIFRAWTLAAMRHTRTGGG